MTEKKNDSEKPTTIKKLTLKKETVRELTLDELDAVAGGAGGKATKCSVGQWGCCGTSKTLATIEI